LYHSNTVIHILTATKMEKLKATKKITMATLKSFAKRNADKLFVKNLSRFNGMSDCVEQVEDDFSKTEVSEEYGFFRTGIQGIYTVGSGRDYFSRFENEKYYGIEVFNSCGSSILAVEK